jgi:hypothetical protein
VYVWPILALVFVFTRSLLWLWWERGLAFAILLSALTVWNLSLGSERIWYAAETDDDTAQTSRLQDEDAFYAQQTLLPKAIESLQAEKPNTIDWYFLGVAGAAYQDVFRNEVETVRSLFDNRFATSGHSLVLINNDESVLREPIATRTSIETALQAMAQKMDKEHDVLFLFITSHGSEDHQIELNYWPLDLAFITPEWLRQTLDDSGIRRRVIVLSACYSGGFIPALQSPDTVIITAASAKQASFGCQGDADLTYFGRAFFDDALRREYSFHASYERAIKAIAAREIREGFDLSNPQWWIGTQMQQDLPLLEKTLFPPAPKSLQP